jgi:putative transposase
MLVGQLNNDVKSIFESIASHSDFDIEVMETDRDHVHFLIRYIPSLSISQIVRRLKQESTYQIWMLHPTLLRKQYWYQCILWSDGYFACSIGEASPETIRQYILSQG